MCQLIESLAGFWENTTNVTTFGIRALMYTVLKYFDFFLVHFSRKMTISLKLPSNLITTRKFIKYFFKHIANKNYILKCWPIELCTFTRLFLGWWDCPLTDQTSTLQTSTLQTSSKHTYLLGLKRLRAEWCFCSLWCFILWFNSFKTTSSPSSKKEKCLHPQWMNLWSNLPK